MSNAILDSNETQSVADDQWTVLQAEKNGKPLLVRYRGQRPPGVDPSAFPFLLSATWTYRPNDAGLPASEEMALMDKFEDALSSALETSQTAYLMVILTGNGERDWLWYTCGEAEAMHQANQCSAATNAILSNSQFSKIEAGEPTPSSRQAIVHRRVLAEHSASYGGQLKKP